MENIISGFVYNIVLFLLFSSLLLQLVAGKKYEKYVRFFSGIILMTLVISPVLDLIGKKNTMNYNYLEECYSQAAKLASEETSNISSIKDRAVSKRYSMQIQGVLEQILKSKGYELVDADIDLEDDSDSANYYYPKAINARVTTDLHNEDAAVEPVSINIAASDDLSVGSESENNDIKVLKTEIANFFSINEGAVIIEVIS